MKARMNISVNYNEGLFYVDYHDIYMYHEATNPSNVIPESKIPAGQEDKYIYDPDMTQAKYEGFRKKLTDYLTSHFPSMTGVTEDSFQDKAKKKRIIAQNELFAIILEDNIWSIAVELKHLTKANKGLQTQMFPSFLEGLRKGLFEQFDTLYVRNGSWSAAPITIDSPVDTGNKFINPEVGYIPTSMLDNDEVAPAYAYATES